MKKRCYLYLLFMLHFITSSPAQIKRVPIGQCSDSSEELILKLESRFQNYNTLTKSNFDIYDPSINSPKSVNYSLDRKKIYVQSLEGAETVVYSTETKKKIKVIKHTFNSSNQYLFKNNESAVFDYTYSKKDSNYNHFSGKPVESCFSHNGRYLWVTYYRRSFDINAVCPSAVAIIDTKTDEIIRVMPTGPLPKMIACSPDNKYIAVTHWGDNTVGIIDISSNNPSDFHYIKHCIVDYQLALNFGNQHINRDEICGYCLRGTVFTPDANFLLIGKMGGVGGIAVLDARSFELLGTVSGMMLNVRHIIIYDDYLYLSANAPGYIQKCNWRELVKARIQKDGDFCFNNFENAKVGYGARTIVITSDGRYVFAAVNNGSKISAIRTSDMKVVAEVSADSYPVGMDISADDKELIVTSQGKSTGGGNSVMIFKIEYKK
jgi:DNA-binding beta-propeller fold protein YncE